MKRSYQSPAAVRYALHLEESVLLSLSGTGNNQSENEPNLNFGGNVSETDGFGQGNPFEAD